MVLVYCTQCFHSIYLWRLSIDIVQIVSMYKAKVATLSPQSHAARSFVIMERESGRYDPVTIRLDI